MRTRLALASSFVVLVAAVVGIIARGPESREALVYTYSFKAGESRTYEMNMRMNFRPEGVAQVQDTYDGTIRSRMVMNTVDVRDDGSAVVELTIKDIEVTGPTGPAAGGIDAQSMKMVVEPNGKIRSVEGSSVFGALDPLKFFGISGGGTGGTLGSSNLFPAFPDEAIAPGDTWEESQELPAPLGGKSFKVTVKGRHEGFEGTRFGRAARMRIHVATPIDFSFSFGDFFNQGGADRTGGLAAAIPANLDNVRMALKGAVTSDLISLVPTGGGDVVSMIGDIGMDIAFKTTGLPESSSQPAGYSLQGEMRMEFVRVS